MSLSEWRRYRLAEVGEFVGGATPSTSVPEYWNGDIEWTTSRLLGKSVTLSKGERRITRLGLEKSSSTLVPSGSLLVGTRVGVGKVAVTGIPVAINQDLTGILVDPLRFDARFLAFHLMTSRVQTELGRRARGVTIKGVPREDLASIEVAAPSIVEQRAIAALLDDVAAAATREERLVGTTRELMQTARREFFAKGLRRASQRETGIGSVPVNWEVATLGAVGRIGNGSTPKRTDQRYWEGGTIPWLTSARVYDRIITRANEMVTDTAVRECHLPTVPAGSLLVAITGQGKTLGNVALTAIQTTVSQHLAYITIQRPHLLGNFLRHYLVSRYQYLRSMGQAGGSTKGALTCAGLKTVPIPVPPEDEQEEIAQILDLMETSIDVHERKRALLEGLFDTLLQGLMTGRVRLPSTTVSERGETAA